MGEEIFIEVHRAGQGFHAQVFIRAVHAGKLLRVDVDGREADNAGADVREMARVRACRQQEGRAGRVGETGLHTLFHRPKARPGHIRRGVPVPLVPGRHLHPEAPGQGGEGRHIPLQVLPVHTAQERPGRTGLAAVLFAGGDVREGALGAHHGPRLGVQRGHKAHDERPEAPEIGEHQPQREGHIGAQGLEHGPHLWIQAFDEGRLLGHGGDITGPSIPRLLGLEHEKAYGTNDAIEPVIDKDGIKVMSLNFLMDDENQPVVWRGPIVGNAVRQFWTDVVWEELDYLLIDMPPGTGDVALTVLQNMPVNGIVMVSTPQPMVSMIVSKAINMCKEVKVPVLGIIENMSYVVCPDCGRHIEIFAHKNTDEFLQSNDVELWAELPMMDAISQIYKDDDFTPETVKKVQKLIAPAVDKLEACMK